MVLIMDDGDRGGSSFVKHNQVYPKSNSDYDGEDEKSSPQSDECLGSCDSDDDDDDVYQEFEEYEDFSELPDTKSIASDDSFYPPDDSLAYVRSPSPESPAPLTFFQACCNNNAIIVKIMIRQGVTEEEVRETDRNNRTGLIVACYQGYVDVVIALSQCPYVDVNWQDNEGNTALITAAQAGHIMISNYLLNYFPGLDIERRNCHGFTAMMKAAMQGRADCVRALMLAGGDLEARDYGRKLTPRQWALFTGRRETAYLMLRLMAQPCAEQFCDTYRAEWPQLSELVAKAREPKGCMRKVAEKVCGAFSLTLTTKTNAQEDGVLDHMVRMTTGLASPFVAVACRTVSPGSPPCLGKRRYAVQEILRRQRVAELRSLGPERLNNYKRLFQNSRVTLVPRKADRRASLQPQLLREAAAAASAVAMRRSSLLPLHMVRRSSVRPGMVVPKVRICKAPPPTYEPEKVGRRKGSSAKDAQHLQIPKWRYKELREERKKAEEAERRRLDMLSRRHFTIGNRK
ncbi:ankyrin repeat domain-containing protein 33B-like [Megalops cyprinoides]|uniref:ankyrin repeat domain-containing protein 33B-like n=1 Tax=Megalops cyprinoides TaxID=118141 RepID=UPI001864FA2B|nr:ankyrin repeat domain-containing protein 33B-like [Megalops cyprinoides]